MKTILVAVDGSAPAKHALSEAVSLARATNAELHLAFAVSLNPLPVELTPAGTAELLAEHRAQGNDIVENARKEVPDDVKVFTHVRDGVADQVINELAGDVNADVVVVGNTGRSAAGRLLLGSTADGLVHLCKRPVLVVR